MNVSLRTYHILLFWMFASWLFLVPSDYYPYRRHEAVALAATLITLIAALCLALSASRRYCPPAIEPRIGPFHLHAARFVLAMTILVDFYGVLGLETSVFDSKERLDDLPYVRSVINFKLLTVPILYLNRKHDPWSFYLQLGASLAYSLLFAERMHIFEVLLAVLTTRMLVTGIRMSVMSIVRYGVLVIALAIGLEATRNFYVQYAVKGESITVGESVRNLSERMSAYYGDTINKLAIVVSDDYVPDAGVGASLLTTQAMKTDEYKLSDVSVLAFARAQGYAFENLTNIGGHTTLFVDFGWGALLLLVVLAMCPILSEELYARTRSIGSLAFASSCVIMVAEMPRLFYWYNLRAHLWVLLLLVIALAERSAQARQRGAAARA